MLFFAIENGLAQYPLNKLGQREHCTPDDLAISLLMSACRPTILSPSVKGIIRPVVIERILKLGADPNRYYEGVDASEQPFKFSATPWGEMLHTLRGLRITSLQGFSQVFEILKTFLENGADPAAQITWTTQAGQGSPRQAFKRTAREQIRDSFIDCFSVEERKASCTTERVLSFVPFEEVMEQHDLSRHLSASSANHPPRFRARTENSPCGSRVSGFPSESEVEQISIWGNALTDLLDLELRKRRQTFDRRRAAAIYSKLRLKSGGLGTRLTHLRRFK